VGAWARFGGPVPPDPNVEPPLVGGTKSAVYVCLVVQVIKMLVVVVALFGVCWLPLHAFMLVIDFNPQLTDYKTPAQKRFFIALFSQNLQRDPVWEGCPIKDLLCVLDRQILTTAALDVRSSKPKPKYARIGLRLKTLFRG